MLAQVPKPKENMLAYLHAVLQWAREVAATSQDICAQPHIPWVYNLIKDVTPCVELGWVEQPWCRGETTPVQYFHLAIGRNAVTGRDEIYFVSSYDFRSDLPGVEIELE